MRTSIVLMGCSQPSRLAPERAPKGEAECSLTTDAFQAVCSGVGDLIDGIGAQIGELFRLEAAPNLLDGIDVRCVARQRLD